LVKHVKIYESLNTISESTSNQFNSVQRRQHILDTELFVFNINITTS